MAELTWEKITVRHGRLDAEMLKTFMEAEGVPVQLIQEGLGQYALPMTIGPLAEVQVFVPKDKLEEAQALIEAFERGEDNMEIAEDEEASDEE